MQFKSLAFLTAAFSAGQVLALNATVVVNGINNITATANDATLAINALNGTNAINTGLVFAHLSACPPVKYRG